MVSAFLKVLPPTLIGSLFSQSKVKETRVSGASQTVSGEGWRGSLQCALGAVVGSVDRQGAERGQQGREVECDSKARRSCSSASPTHQVNVQCARNTHRDGSQIQGHTHRVVTLPEVPFVV